MGASGADILLSPAARKLFPFYVEAKNRESLNIWQALGQAANGALNGTFQIPLVVFRRNHATTYAALPWADLLVIVKRANG